MSTVLPYEELNEDRIFTFKRRFFTSEGGMSEGGKTEQEEKKRQRALKIFHRFKKI